MPLYIPGPLNGDPYAQVFKGKIRHDFTMDNKTVTQPGGQKKSYDLAKGIKDLDDLLGELGSLTSVRRQGATESINISKKDENANFTTTNELQIDVKKQYVAESSCIPNGHIFKSEQGDFETSEKRNKPSLPGRTSSFQAVTRHQRGSGSIQRSLSEGNTDEKDEINHSIDSTDGIIPVATHVSVAYHESSLHPNVFGRDEVFDAGALSPTVSDLLHELNESPLSSENMKKSYAIRRNKNTSLKYDNEDSISGNSSDGRSSPKGVVAAYAKQFDELRTSPYPLKTAVGVPMPGLVQGVDYEDKISQFNYRSLAPGQSSPRTERLYLSRSPPKKIEYDHTEPEEIYPYSSGSGSYESDKIFIPAYADRPVEYYLEEKRQQGKKCFVLFL